MQRWRGYASITSCNEAAAEIWQTFYHERPSADDLDPEAAGLNIANAEQTQGVWIGTLRYVDEKGETSEKLFANFKDFAKWYVDKDEFGETADGVYLQWDQNQCSFDADDLYQQLKDKILNLEEWDCMNNAQQERIFFEKPNDLKTLNDIWVSYTTGEEKEKDFLTWALFAEWYGAQEKLFSEKDFGVYLSWEKEGSHYQCDFGAGDLFQGVRTGGEPENWNCRDNTRSENIIVSKPAELRMFTFTFKQHLRQGFDHWFVVVNQQGDDAEMKSLLIQGFGVKVNWMNFQLSVESWFGAPGAWPCRAEAAHFRRWVAAEDLWGNFLKQGKVPGIWPPNEEPLEHKLSFPKYKDRLPEE